MNLGYPKFRRESRRSSILEEPTAEEQEVRVTLLLPDEQNSFVQSKRDMVPWYKQPGVRWLEGMPRGKGMIGAMVFGGVPVERIALNEGTFWSGRPHDYDSVS